MKNLANITPKEALKILKDNKNGFLPPYANEEGGCAYCGYNPKDVNLDLIRKDIEIILDQQEFEVNEPPLNRCETIKKLINLFEKNYGNR